MRRGESLRSWWSLSSLGYSPTTSKAKSHWHVHKSPPCISCKICRSLQQTHGLRYLIFWQCSSQCLPPGMRRRITGRLSGTNTVDANVWIPSISVVCEVVSMYLVSEINVSAEQSVSPSLQGIKGRVIHFGVTPLCFHGRGYIGFFNYIVGTPAVQKRRMYYSVCCVVRIMSSCSNCC
jgi:hypothetical protein